MSYAKIITKIIPDKESKINNFQKFDSEKPRISLIEPDFILGLAKVLTFGAKKYEANNWKKITIEDKPRIIDAMQRHLLAYQNGEKFDKESELSHLYHAAFGLMVLNEMDNR